jgi:N-acetylmuramate 1-kinase
MTNEARHRALHEFVARTLSDDSVVLEPASADASFRSYFRATSKVRGERFIAMDAPPERGEDIVPWLDIAARLRRAQLNAPQVFGEDRAQGFVLMSDLGTRPYLAELNEATVDRLYGDAMDALLGMQTRVPSEGLPRFDEGKLVAELELMPQWFLARHLGIEPGCDGWDRIELAFRVIVNSALEQPTAFMHRDYHSRNLMIVPGQNPGIIDFQGAMLGPVTYDLASLLRDCYIAWPAERVYGWANQYRDRLVDRGLVKFGEVRWKRWFDLMGLQRHLKVLGLFCRLWYRDGKAGYLDDLPLVFTYTIEVAMKNKELAPFAQWLQRCVGNRDLRQPAKAAA